jgi:hypothetical protein
MFVCSHRKHGRALLEDEGAAAPQAPDCCVNRKPEEQWGLGHRAFRGGMGHSPTGMGGDQRGCAGRRRSEGERAGPNQANSDARARRDGRRGFVNEGRRDVIGACCSRSVRGCPILNSPRRTNRQLQNGLRGRSLHCKDIFCAWVYALLGPTAVPPRQSSIARNPPSRHPPRFRMCPSGHHLASVPTVGPKVYAHKVVADAETW